MTLEEIVRQKGFSSEKEFHELVAAVDLSVSENMQAFVKWRLEDGTKEGLLKLDHQITK